MIKQTLLAAALCAPVAAQQFAPMTRIPGTNVGFHDDTIVVPTTWGGLPAALVLVDKDESFLALWSRTTVPAGTLQLWGRVAVVATEENDPCAVGALAFIHERKPVRGWSLATIPSLGWNVSSPPYGASLNEYAVGYFERNQFWLSYFSSYGALTTTCPIGGPTEPDRAALLVTFFPAQ